MANSPDTAAAYPSRRSCSPLNAVSSACFEFAHADVIAFVDLDTGVPAPKRDSFHHGETPDSTSQIRAALHCVLSHCFPRPLRFKVLLVLSHSALASVTIDTQ